MFLDNVLNYIKVPLAKAGDWLDFLEKDLEANDLRSHDAREKARFEIAEKKAKEESKLWDLLAASSLSPGPLLALFKRRGMSLDKLPPVLAGLYMDSVNAEAHNMSLAEKKKYSSQLPGFSVSTNEHEKLLTGLGLSIDDSSHNIGHLKDLLVQKRNSIVLS